MKKLHFICCSLHILCPSRLQSEFTPSSCIKANWSELTECTHENDAPVNAVGRGEARLSPRDEEPLDGVGDGALPRGGGGQELGVGLRSPQSLSGVIRFHGGVSHAID